MRAFQLLQVTLFVLVMLPGRSAMGQQKEQLTAWQGARILTAADQIFDPGVLIVRGDRIEAVGKLGEVEIPSEARIIDARGRVIIPGLVDTHSHLGVYTRPGVSANSDGNEMTGPVQSMVRALDSLNAFDPGIRMANAGGVTTANVMPGSGNVIGGQTIYVKLRGNSAEKMQVEASGVLGGLKMANGENPKRSYGNRGQAPGTRMKIAALQRAEFIKARNYQQKWNHYRQAQQAGDRKIQPPDRDLGLEPLVEVLERKRTVHFHSHRADDILTVLRLRQEFDFELVIQHGTEAYKVLDEIAKHGVPISMTVVDSPGGKAEVVDLIEECGAELARAGIRVIVNTDDPVTESRFFLRTAAIPYRGGLSEDLALKSITKHPAEAMHLDERIGTLEAGKDADFVILSGAPFSIYTRVLETFIDGRRVFELAQDSQRSFQEGGLNVEPDRLPTRPQLLKAPPTVSAPQVPDQAPVFDPVKTTEYLVRAGRLHTAAGSVINNGVVHVKQGKIMYAGPLNDAYRGEVRMPVLAATEVTPGLIDTFSVVPLAGEYNIPADQDSNEQSDPIQAETRVLDAFNPAEPLMRFLLEQGITVIHACPGRKNVIGGQTGVFRTHGRSAESMVVKFPFGMLFSLGEIPKETYSGKRPATRMGTASLIREALNSARIYRDQRKQHDESDGPFDRDLAKDALADVLDGSIIPVFTAQRADDLQTAMRLMSEFELRGPLTLGAEAYLIRDQIQAEDLPVIVHPTMQRVGGIETYRSYLGNAAALADRKIPVTICSGIEGYVPKTRVIRHEAGMAMVYGLGFDRALRAITIDAAKLLGIAQTHGSLEAGKVADLVLYDGNPFEHATHVTHVIVDGKLVHRRSDRQRLPLAERMLLNLPDIPCCLGF